MCFSTSTLKSIISWLYAECMQGRISTTRQSTGFWAVSVRKEWLLLPYIPAEGGQMPAGHTAPILPNAACAWRELRKSVTVPAQPNTELCCILLKQRTAPGLFCTACGLTPCSKIIIHGGTCGTLRSL